MINILKTYQTEQAENMKNAGNTQALVKLGDLFQVTVSSDRFKPRVKSGEMLIMATGGLIQLFVLNQQC
jgi:hypothetical protein